MPRRSTPDDAAVPRARRLRRGGPVRDPADRRRRHQHRRLRRRRRRRRGAMPLRSGCPAGPARGGRAYEPADRYPVAAAGRAAAGDGWEVQARVRRHPGRQPHLAHAVYGFFNNGGSRCWVARVADGPATRHRHRADRRRWTVFTADRRDRPRRGPRRGQRRGADAPCSTTARTVLQDRFAILDGQPRPPTLTTGRHPGCGPRQQLRRRSTSRGSRSATRRHGAPVYVPPSGHIAGVYARVDAERGVHKAPANEVIRGALGVETAVSKAGQAGLNPDGINVIRQLRRQHHGLGRAHSLAGKERRVDATSTSAGCSTSCASRSTRAPSGWSSSPTPRSCGRRSAATSAPS